MSKLPLLSANEFIKILEKLGFQIMRQEGSHVFMKHKDGRTTVVPKHPGEDLDRGLLNKIIKKDLNMEREDFLRIIKNN
jgi:predicted RNA binding protein YcfA (HicA-like mRNA interferase family)